MILAENDLSKYVHSDYIKTEKDDFEEVLNDCFSVSESWEEEVSVCNYQIMISCTCLDKLLRPHCL